MSRKKQIEEITKLINTPCNDRPHDNCYEYGCLKCQAGLIYDAGYRKQSEWISVEERLPDNYRAVLVACEYTTIGGGARIAIGSYGGGFWSLADADGTHYLTKYMHAVVTHWMPLP